MQTTLFDCPLELDERGLEQRSTPTVLVDENLKILLRQNRLGLQRGKTRRKWIGHRSKSVLDIPLRCIAHAHPDCRFRWVSISLNFNATPDTLIQELSPDEVVGEEPIKITTRYEGGLSFELDKFKVGPEVSRERSTEYQIYYPEITSSGVGFSTGVWRFRALADQDLYVDRDLRVLVSFPADIEALPVRFILRAKVVAKGIESVIPLVGRKQVNIEFTEDIN